MLNYSISQDWRGWAWEIADSDEVYLRSERVFACEREAREDMKNSTYLIRSQLRPH